jgi:gluconolactonase
MTTGSAIRRFTLDLDDLEWTGHDLVRPESVVAEPDGTLWASDARGGVTRTDPGGGQAFLSGWGGEPQDMLAAAGPTLQFPTSVCFGGEDLRTVYVGSLAMPRLPTFRSPVPGLPMSHWR